MSMKINYNVSAMIANNSLKLNDNKLSTSLARLSSGYKINSAKDNPAGLAISRRMNAQIKGLNAAAQDAKDGVSVVEIADGALAEVHDILQRMNELAIKSSTETMSDDDRVFVQQEVQQLAEEIDRIGQTTEFNGQKLFDGSFDLKGYTDNIDIKVDYYSDVNLKGKYELSLDAINYDKDGKVVDVNGDPNRKVEVTRPDGTTENYIVTGDIFHLTFKGDHGDEFQLDMAGTQKSGQITPAYDRDNPPAGGYKYTPAAGNNKLTIDMTGYGGMTFQIGANEHQTIDIRMQKISMETLGFKNQDSDELKDMILDMSTAKGADEAIDQVKYAISKVSAFRSKLGAYQNRLEHTETNLSTSEENMTAAYSRIMDTDMAEEMSNYSNLQIVSQAATSILAQANERPSQMLQLLQ